MRIEAIIWTVLLLIGAPSAASAQPAAAEGPRMDIYEFAMLDMGLNFKTIDPNWYDTMRINRLPSFDKEFVREWLTSPASGWDKASGAAPPPLPDDVLERTRAKYVEAFERLTGRTFAAG